MFQSCVAPLCEAADHLRPAEHHRGASNTDANTEPGMYYAHGRAQFIHLVRTLSCFVLTYPLSLARMHTPPRVWRHVAFSPVPVTLSPSISMVSNVACPYFNCTYEGHEQQRTEALVSTLVVSFCQSLAHDSLNPTHDNRRGICAICCVPELYST